MSEIKNPGKSIRAKLLNVAKQKDVFYQTILTRYFQERLLYRISQTHYRENFYLKGGALMYAYERFAARPTLDIDFLGTHISNDGERIAEAFREICAVECEEDGVRFAADKIAAQNITEFKDYHGIRLSIPATMDTIAQVMTMDIGFGDVVTPHPVSLDYPLLLEELPEANILAYSTETVIAEKMHAIIDLADQSSRMKDYYDIYHLLTSFKYDNTILQEAINRTFENRHTLYNADMMFFRKDFPNHPQMQLRWSAFLKKATIKNSLSFSEVAIPASESGMTILNSTTKSFAPSNLDDSTSSSGILAKKLRSKIILKVLIPKGINNPQRELYIPSPFRIRKNGMTPPPKNIVKMMPVIRTLRKGSVLEERTYAPIVVMRS